MNMLKTPEISVVTPVYNGNQYLNDTIYNIINLNRDINLEYIPVNDGSQDETGKLCKEWQSKYPEIIKYVELTKNGGIVKARNKGLEAATKKWITFADQDDKVNDGYRSYVVRLENERADMLIANYFRGMGGQNSNIRLCGYLRDEVIKNKERINDMLRFLISGGIIAYHDVDLLEKPQNTCWNCIFSRDIIKENNIQFYTFIDYEDDYNFLCDNLQCSNTVITSATGWYIWYDENFASESHRRKYIPDFQYRYLASREWSRHKCEYLNVSAKEWEAVSASSWKWMLLWGIYNASWKIPFSYSEFVHEIEDMADSIEKSVYKKMDLRGKVEKIFIFLIKSKQYRMAAFVNRNIFRKRFH